MKSTKFLILCALTFANSGVAIAGESSRVSVEVPEATGADQALIKYQEKINELNDVSLTVADYKKLASAIHDDFVRERTPIHQEIRATEVLQCKVEAKRPEIFKGRNKDACRIANDLSLFTGWEFSGKTETEFHQYDGGSNTHSVTVDDATGAVILNVACTSPSQDDFNHGRCGRTQQISITYKKSNDLVERDVLLEAQRLVFW